MSELLSFEQSVELKEVGADTFENVHQPWTWWGGTVIGGGLLMGLSATAAYRTVPDTFVLDSVQTQFLSGANPKLPITYRVYRTTNGRRFTVRNVTAEQAGRAMVSTTMTFVSKTLSHGPSMQHSVARDTQATVNEITLDDLEKGRTRFGPLMQFERLPLVHSSPQQPQTTVFPVVAKIIPAIDAPTGDIAHTLGLLNLTDYHMLDAAPTLHGLTVGSSPIGQQVRERTRNDIQMYTSLNHTVHFHMHDGYRADELTYIEITSPWAKDDRAVMNSRLFTKEGQLIATCVQEAYYVLKPGTKTDNLSKL